MSILRQKSNFNISAAELLLENDLYAPSVHCSYYGCFQLLKFIINDFFGISYSALSSNISNSNKNTHRYIIDYIHSEIKNKLSREDERKFIRTIKDLKRFREDSDYENIEIDFEKGNKALSLTKELTKYLTKNFNL